MLTTCPECHTTFRVSQTQLDQRRGLVRCGRCSAVFNAYDTLLPELATPAQEEAALQAAAERPAAPPAEIPVTGATPAIGAAAEFVSPSSADGGPMTAATSAPEGDALLTDWRRTPPETTLARPKRGKSATDTATDRAAIKLDASPSASETPEAILLSALPTSRGPVLPGWRSALWMLASAVLALTFLLQIIYFLRAEIAAAWPETRPVLEDACQRLGCTLPLPRDPTALRFDASALETDPEDATRAVLRVSLSNRSDRTIAWPHLVLILTDVRDVPVAQRPFPPSDYLTQAGLETQGMAPREEREIRLELELKGLSAYGYKLDKRYP